MKVIQHLLFFVFCFVASACAVAVVDPQPSEMLRFVIEAFSSGKYYYAAALILVGLVGAAKYYGASRIKWLTTDQGGAFLVLMGSFGAVLSATLADGSTPSLASVYQALIIAVTASGGYTIVKRLIVTPYLAPLVKKYPSLALILWIFEGKK
jgi:hypothetical protein